jgi:hypothetical protein
MKALMCREFGPIETNVTSFTTAVITACSNPPRPGAAATKRRL